MRDEREQSKGIEDRPRLGLSHFEIRDSRSFCLLCDALISVLTELVSWSQSFSSFTTEASRLVSLFLFPLTLLTEGSCGILDMAEC